MWTILDAASLIVTVVLTLWLVWMGINLLVVTGLLIYTAAAKIYMWARHSQD